MPQDAIDYSKLSERELEAIIAKEEQKNSIDYSNLSNEELETLASSEEKIDSLNTTDDWSEYLWNQARIGAADSLSIGSAALDTFLLDPLQNLYNNPTVIFDPDSYGKKNIPFTDESNLGRSFVNRFEGYTDLMSEYTGADPTLQAESDALRYAGTGVRILSDPLGYTGLGMAGRAAGLAKTIQPVAETASLSSKAISGGSRAGSLGLVGVGSEVGGDVGASIDKTFSDGNTGTGRAIGTLIGGFGLPLTSTLTTRAVTKPVVQIYQKYKAVRENPQMVEQSYATGAAKRLLELVAKEEGVDNINDIVIEFNRLGKFLNGEELPLMVAMSDNPIIQSQVVKLAKTNEAFRNSINKELQRLTTQLDNKANVIFGTRYTIVSGLEDAPLAISKKVEDLRAQRIKMDDEIEALGDTLVPTMTEQQTGNVIKSLILKREKLAKAEMSPHYDAILKQAKVANAKMSSDGVSNIYQFIQQNKFSDIFGKGTALDNKLTAFTKPRIKLIDGKKVTRFPEMSFEQLDSLKRAMNSLKGKPLNATERRKLSDLEDVIDSARDTIPGNFSDNLKAIDKLYYEKVGVPFGSAGMKQVNAKKYAEEVAPVILKNESALDSFLNVAGKEGNEIARNAYLAKVYDKVVKNGDINNKALQSLMKKDASIINKVPGLKSELDDIITNNGNLFLARDNLNVAFKRAENEVTNNFLTTSNLAPNYAQVAQRLSEGDTNFLAKIKKDISSLDKATQQAVNKNIQREFLETVFNRPEGGVKFLANIKNRDIVNKVFSDNKEYLKNVKDLSKISDALNKAGVDKFQSIVKTENLDIMNELIPGLNVQSFTATMRRPIIGPTQKGVILLTRINQARARTAVDKQFIEVLQNQEGVAKLASTARSFDFKIDNPIAIKRLINILSETVPAYFYSATKSPLNQEVEGEIINEIIQ